MSDSPLLAIREIKPHTALRGIAAVAVFLGHAQFDTLWPGAVWLSGLYRFFYWQNPAVDLFFMLSGFVLNYVYLKQRRMRWRGYFNARFARICPLYYAGLVAVLAMNVASAHFGESHSLNLTPSILLPNLAMVQEWPFFGHVDSIDVPSWSISVEVFLYIAIFPLLAFVLARRRLGGGVSLSILLVALLVNTVLGRDFAHPLDLEYAPLIRGVSGFTAGFLICELLYGRETPLIPGSAEIVLGVFSIAMLPFDAAHAALPAVFAALIAVTYSPASRLGAFLASPVFMFLGRISYSVYIWHYPVIKACTILFGVRRMGASGSDSNPTLAHKLLYFSGTSIAVLAVASISFYWFETPLRQLLRGSPRNRPNREPGSQKAGLILS